MKNTATLASDVEYVSVDLDSITGDTRKNLEECFERLDRIERDQGLYDVTGLFKLQDYDEAMLDTWSAIETLIQYADSDYGKKVEEFKSRTRSVVSGTLQAIGGASEAVTGGIIVAGTTGQE